MERGDIAGLLFGMGIVAFVIIFIALAIQVK
jgi:hypothetical protein